MKFEVPETHRPKNVEQLNRKEQVKRFHHQLSVIYDRTFLTGDWGGDHTDQEKVRSNFFEDKIIDDADALPDELNEYLNDVQRTVPSLIIPNKHRSRDGKHEHNRKLFLDIVAHSRDILVRAKKDIDVRSELALFKAVDENMVFFRDMPSKLKMDRYIEPETDSERFREGLENILETLETIRETGPRESPKEH